LNTSKTLIIGREPKFLSGDCSIQKGRGFNRGIGITTLCRY